METKTNNNKENMTLQELEQKLIIFLTSKCFEEKEETDCRLLTKQIDSDKQIEIRIFNVGYFEVEEMTRHRELQVDIIGKDLTKGEVEEEYLYNLLKSKENLSEIYNKVRKVEEIFQN